MIYADNAATTKMSEAAIDTMVKTMNETFGNPSSLYEVGQKAKEVLEQARADVAAVIGADPREITFTSGGSEADNQAIRSAAALGAKKGKKHIISSAFEHHAVLHTITRSERSSRSARSERSAENTAFCSIQMLSRQSGIFRSMSKKTISTCCPRPHINSTAPRE